MGGSRIEVSEPEAGMYLVLTPMCSASLATFVADEKHDAVTSADFAYYHRRDHTFRKCAANFLRIFSEFLRFV